MTFSQGSSEKASNLPKKEYEKSSPLEKDLIIKYQNNDRRYGKISIIETPMFNKPLDMRESITNKKQHQAVGIINLKKRIRLNHPFLLTLHDYSSAINSNMCSTSYKLREFWDHSETDLYEEMVRRERRQQPFSDKELTYLFHNLIHAIGHLHDHAIAHTDVSPIYVDIGNPNSLNYKLMDRGISFSTFESVCYNNIMIGREIFAAPEVFTNARPFKKGAGFNKEINPGKADAFSLGMTILRLGIGRSIQNCYNENNRSFNQEILEGYVNEFSQKYSNQALLAESLNQILNPNPNQRWDVQRLRSEFPDHQVINDFYAEQQSENQNIVNNQDSQWGQAYHNLENQNQEDYSMQARGVRNGAYSFQNQQNNSMVRGGFGGGGSSFQNQNKQSYSMKAGGGSGSYSMVRGGTSDNFQNQNQQIYSMKAGGENGGYSFNNQQGYSMKTGGGSGGSSFQNQNQQGYSMKAGGGSGGYSFQNQNQKGYSMKAGGGNGGNFQNQNQHGLSMKVGATEGGYSFNNQQNDSMVRQGTSGGYSFNNQQGYSMKAGGGNGGNFQNQNQQGYSMEKRSGFNSRGEQKNLMASNNNYSSFTKKNKEKKTSNVEKDSQSSESSESNNLQKKKTAVRATPISNNNFNNTLENTTNKDYTSKPAQKRSSSVPVNKDLVKRTPLNTEKNNNYSTRSIRRAEPPAKRTASVYNASPRIAPIRTTTIRRSPYNVEEPKRSTRVVRSQSMRSIPRAAEPVRRSVSKVIKTLNYDYPSERRAGYYQSYHQNDQPVRAQRPQSGIVRSTRTLRRPQSGIVRSTRPVQRPEHEVVRNSIKRPMSGIVRSSIRRPLSGTVRSTRMLQRPWQLQNYENYPEFYEQRNVPTRSTYLRPSMSYYNSTNPVVYDSEPIRATKLATPLYTDNEVLKSNYKEKNRFDDWKSISSEEMTLNNDEPNYRRAVKNPKLKEKSVRNTNPKSRDIKDQILNGNHDKRNTDSYSDDDETERLIFKARRIDPEEAKKLLNGTKKKK